MSFFGRRTKQHTNPTRNAERTALRLAKRAKTTAAQKLKPTKARKHKKYHHPLRDGMGAYTLIGRVEDGKRMWLAGISAQRGF